MTNNTFSTSDFTAFGYNCSNISAPPLKINSEPVFNRALFTHKSIITAQLHKLNNFFRENYLHSQCVADNITCSPVHIENGGTQFHPLAILDCNPSSWFGIKQVFHTIQQFLVTLDPQRLHVMIADLVFFDKYYRVCTIYS
jgi:hypothetical protein